MATRRTRLATVASVAALAAGGYFIYGLFAAQGQGVLAQAPLNTQVQVPPAFIMAIDDSGSMTFHNQFPGADGKACWSRDTSSSPYSFFITSGVNAGQLRTGTTSGGACGWAFSYGSSPRNGENNSWRGIPPVDTMGFARSSDYNPAYFDPTVTYQPWLNSDGTSFGNASLTATRIDPRAGGAGLGTVNLTAWHDGTAVAGGNGQLSDRFNTFNGMVLPAGTVYRTENTDGCGGLQGRTRDNWWDDWTYWHTLSSDHSMTAQCNVFIRHRLATFYLKSDERPPGYESVPRSRAEDACGPGCDMWRYDIRATDTAALQNFANWFSYYGNRHRALVAGLTRSLVDIENMRVGYFRISQHGGFDAPNLNATTSGNERVNMLDMADGADKAALYNQILATPSWSSTFNRQSVYAGGRQFMRTDPLNSNAGGAPVQRACQKNALMLFTDGYSNGGGPDVGGNIDGSLGVPFSDGHGNTMADIATTYYVNDADGNSPLNTNFPEGQVPVPSSCPSSDPRVDCQANLHVNFYGITLGGRGNLFDPESDVDPYTTPAVYNNWPARQDDNRSTVDDIWHAAVNTRGELVNARTPADILAAMRRILSSVTAGSSPSGTIALTGARISSGSLAVAPRYEVANEGTDWFSELTAQTVAVHPTTRAAEFTFAWEASDEFPAPGARDVFFGRGNNARRFETPHVSLGDLCTNELRRCTAAEITALGVNITQALSYLKGDTTLEKKNGGVLRDRTTILGDIVNSTPVVSSPIDDYGYGSMSGTLGTSYRNYLTTKRNTHRYMVYVGANDGMLHAFDGGMGADAVMDGNGGREEFAYIPETALGHMGNLLFPYDPANDNDQKFDHRYYVDGPVTVSDVHAGSWRTVLVGTAGAGGRSVFALDVTDPDSFGTGDRLWEINNLNTALSSAVRDNIGHVLGKPVIVPIQTTTDSNPRWVALFGNGYNSASGKAVLFVVDIASGTTRMIEAVETGAGVPSGSNGLGNIVAVDRWGGARADGFPGQFRDGFVDTVYGADQRGALWKFDLRTAIPTGGATISRPLFTTRTHAEGSNTYRQPITGGITTATGPNGGVMLYFGTGSFSFVNDPAEDEVQSLYAVNDTERGATTTTVTRALLQGYSVTTVDSIRTTTAGAAPLAARGWFVDLPAGERFVGYPRIATGMVFMPTYAPQSVASGCSTSGFNWLFGLNSRSGAAGLSSVRFGSPTGASPAIGTAAVALETGGSAPVKDVGVMAIPRLNPPGAPPAGPPGAPPPDPPEQGCWMMVTVSGAQPMYLPYPCGRQSWRQLQ